MRTRGKPCSDITQHDLGHLAGHCRHLMIPACWSICLSAHRVQLPNVASFATVVGTGYSIHVDAIGAGSGRASDGAFAIDLTECVA